MAKRVSPRAPAHRQVPSGVPARAWLLRTTALLPIAFGAAGAWAQSAVAPTAGPTGGQVVAGQASIATAPNRTTITQTTNRGVIDWQRFNVGSQHTVQFQQPNAGSWTLNRVVTSDPSVIAGRIQANGGVAIVNQSGIVFSQGAQVDVGSLIASAPGITNENFMAGRMRFDQAARPGARVENRGRITVPDRGIAVLAGPRVTNSGEIHARLGRVVLAGAETYALDLAGDGLLSIDVTQAVRGDGAAIVTNEGLIEANGGSVLLTASAAGDLVEGLVRNTGRITANTEAGRTGEVALRAAGGGVEVTGAVTATGAAGQRGGRIAVQSGESVRVAAGAVLDASGGAGGGTVLVGTTGVGRNQTMARRTTVERGTTISADATVLGQGGTIAINSTEMTVVEGRLTARGGPQGGDGGLIELSGQGELRLRANWDASAPAGQAGSLLLDPNRIEVNNDTPPDVTIPVSGDLIVSDSNGGTVELNAGQLAASGGNITLEARLGISFDAGVFIIKENGNLTLRTTADVGTSGLTGISIAGPVGLTNGSFLAETNGTFTIASGGSLGVNGATTTISATGNISIGGALEGHAIALNTDGAITQTARLTADSLTIRGRDASATSRAGSVVLLDAGNDIRLLDARTTGELTLLTAASGGLLAIRQANGSGGVTIAGISGASLAVEASGTGGLGITSGGDIRLAGDSVTVDHDILTGASRLIGIELRAGGALTGTGTITATNGTVRIGAVTDGHTALRIADEGTAGRISVSSAMLQQVSTGTLEIGRAFDGTVTATAITVGADITLQAGTRLQMDASTGDITISAGITAAGATITAADGAITLGDTGSINVGGDTLTFQAAGAVTQEDGATITAATLTVLGATGGTTEAASVNLNQGGNAIAAIGTIQAAGAVTIHAGTGALSVGTIAAGDDVALTAGGAITVSGAVAGGGITITSTGGDITQSAGSIATAGTLALRSDGTVGQTGGTISAGSLSITGADGGATAAAAITLDSAGNLIDTISTALASGAITIRSDAAALSVGTITGAGVTIRGGAAAGTDIELTGAVNAGSGNALTLATDGAIVQDAGSSITAGTLTINGQTVAAAASAVLTRANAIGQLDAETSGALEVTSTLTLGVTRASGSSVALTATAINLGDATATAGDLVLNATGAGGIVFDATSSLTGASGNRVVLRTDALSIDAGATLTLTGSNVEIGPETEGRAILLASPGTGLSLDTATLGRLTGSGAALLRFGETVIDADTRLGGDLTLGTGLSFAAGNITLISNGAVALGGNGITTQDLRIQADGAISGSGALHTASLTIRGASGGDSSSADAITLTGADNRLGILDARSSGATDVTNTGAALTVRQAHASAVTIDGFGQNVTVQAGGGGITATTGDVAVRAANITLDDAITIEGGNRTLTLQIAGGGTITGSGTLGANGGTVMIGADLAGGALTIGAGGIAASVLNNADASTIIVGQSSFGAGPLVQAGAITVSAAVTAPGVDTLSFLAGTSFTATANISAGSVAITTAGGAITLTNAQIAATTAGSGSVILDAGGSIAQTGGGIDAPRFAAIARSGSIDLSGTSNAIRHVVDSVTAPDTTTRGLYATGGITLVNTGSLSIDTGANIEAAGGAVALTSGSIDQQARIVAGNGVATLTATGGGGMTLGAEIVADTLALRSAGSINQTGGMLTARSAGSVTLTVTGAGGTGTAGGAVNLDLDNNIGSIDAQANGDLTLRSVHAGGLILQTIAGDAVTLTATGGDITQAIGTLVTANSLSASAQGSILLDAGDPGRTGDRASWNQVGALGAVTATGGSFVLNTNTNLAISDVVQASGATIAANGTLTLGSGGSILTSTGAIQLAALGDVTLHGTLSAAGGTGLVTIASLNGAIAQDAGAILAGTFAATGTEIDVSQNGNEIGLLALRTSGDLSFDAGAGTFTLSGAVSVATITGTDSVGGLSAGGDLSISAGTINGGPGSAFEAGIGHSITLRADVLNLQTGTSIGAQGGGQLARLSIGPRTSNRAMVIGGAGMADALNLSDDTMVQLLGVNTQVLQLGRTVVGDPVLAGDILIQSALSASGRLVLTGSGSITLAQTLTTTTGDIELVAGGGIVETASGGLTPGSGLLVVSAGGDIDLRNGSNNLNALAAESSTGGVFVTVAGSGVTLTTGSGSVTGLDGVVHTVAGVSAATQVFLQAAAITVGAAAPVIAGDLATPGSVTLRTDSLDIQGTVQAPGGTVAIEPLTLTSLPQIQLGGTENASTLWVSNDELGRITAATLVFGRSDGSGNARNIRTSEAGTDWSGALRLVGNDVAIAGTLAPSSLALWVSGTVTDYDFVGGTNIGRIDTSSLTLRGLAGSETDGGAISLVGRNVLAGESQHIGALDIRSSGTVTLYLDAEAGNIQANQIRGASVAIFVTNGGLTVAGGGATTTSGGLTLQAAGALSIDAALSVTGGNLTLTGASVTTTAAGDATVTGTAQVTATGGGATLDGDITASAITLTATGAMSVGGTLSVTGGNLTLTGASVTTTAAGDATVTGTAQVTATGGGATLDGDITASAITLTATGAMSVGGTVQATAGNLTITGSSVALTSGVTVNNGAVSITANAGDATVGGAISARAVTVTSSGVMTVGGTITATNGDATLTSGGSLTINDAITAGAGNVVIDTQQALVVNADVTAAATGSVTLRAGAAGVGNATYTITQSGGAIGGTGGGATGLVVRSRSTGATIEATPATPNRIATLDATAAGALAVNAEGVLTVLQAIDSVGGNVTLNAASLALSGPIGASLGTIDPARLGTVDLRTTSGGVTQTSAGVITAQTLLGAVAGDVTLTTAANAIAETGSFTFGGNFALRTSGTLAVTEALTATSGRTITLQAGGNLALQESLRADAVSLAATLGIDQIGGIIAAVTSGVRTSLDATAGAGVSLDSAANNVGTLTGGNGGSGGFLLRNNGTLTVTGLVQTGAGTTLQLDAAGAISLASGGSLSAAGGTVALTADGVVTLAGAITAANAFITTASTLQQSAGGIATTGVLAVRATDISLQGPGNAISQLAAEATAGNVVVASTGTMATGGGTPPGGTLISGVSGNTVFLTASGLNINQAVTSAPGSTVTLRADSMNIAAAVSASGGTVLLEQAAPGGGISLGAENPAALSLSTPELAQVNANLLVIGRGSGQIVVAGDIQAPASLPILRLLGSDIAVNALMAGPVGGVTQLQAQTGSITTAGSGRVTGQRLEVSAAGNIALTGANDFAEVTGSAPGNFAYRDSNGFAVAAPGIQAGNVSLSSDAGNITQQAGAAIVTGALDARAAAGSVLLDGGSGASAGADLNRVGAVTRLVASSGGLALLRNAHGFDMAGLADNGAGGMLGTLQLFAASGSITQSAGPLRVGRLEAQTPGGSLLLGQANGITTLGETRVAGDLVVTNDSSLILAAPVDVGSFGGGGFGTAILTANNGNLQQTAGARLSADRLIANALTGSVLLDGGGSINPADLLRVADLAGGYAAQSMVLRFGSAVTVNGLVQAGATSGTPTGTLVLEAPGLTIGSPGQGGTLLRAGTVVLRTQADFDGPAIPGSGNIIQQGGAIEAVNLAASAPDGDVLLGLTSNRFNALAPGLSANGTASAHSLIAGGSIDIAEGGPGFIVLGGLQNDGSGIQLRSLGNLTFNAATSVSGSIDLSAAGTVTIGTAADLRSGTLLTLNGGAGIAVQGAVTAPDILANTGGTFALTGSGRIAGGSGPGGSVSVTAGHVETSGGAISAYDIMLQTGAGNIVNTSFAASNLVNLLAGGALQVVGIGVNADAMQARTSGLLTLSGGSYTIGSVVVFAGSAGINTEGTVQVRPRTPGLFPAIVLDSRAPGTQPDPLTIARPDVAGLAPDLQETQVRLPNTDAPGDFGAASGAPAGAIHFSLDAGQSPLFLLIDGGSATGTVNTSGRIGIHGRSGTVEITGTLVDPSGQRIEGQAAARMTDATRPATGTEISRFRINDCVVSSFNCVVPAQVIVVPTAAPVPPPLIYGGVGRDPDAVSPNVSEEWTAPGDDEEEDKR